MTLKKENSITLWIRSWIKNAQTFQYIFSLGGTVWIKQYYILNISRCRVFPISFCIMQARLPLMQLSIVICRFDENILTVYISKLLYYLSFITEADVIIVIIVAKVSYIIGGLWTLLFLKNAQRIVIRRSFVNGLTVTKSSLRKVSCGFKFLAPRQQQGLLLDSIGWETRGHLQSL